MTFSLAAAEAGLQIGSIFSFQRSVLTTPLPEACCRPIAGVMDGRWAYLTALFCLCPDVDEYFMLPKPGTIAQVSFAACEV